MKNKILNIVLRIFIDCLIISSFFFLACCGSFYNTMLPSQNIIFLFLVGVGNVILTISLFGVFKIYRIITSVFSIADSLRVAIIALSSNLLCYIVLIVGQFVSPNTISQINFLIFAFSFIITTIVLVFVRLMKRIFVSIRSFASTTKKERTIVIGAGYAGKIIVDDARRNKKLPYNIVCIVDDDKSKIGGLFSGVSVKGPISNIANIVGETQAKTVIIAIQSLDKEQLMRIVSLLSTSDVCVKRLPLLSEMKDVHDQQIKPLNIDELLGREPITLDNSEISNMIENKNVLVTGAGGSIGSELVRQLICHHPKKLILFDIYEHGVYKLQQELIMEQRDDKYKDVEIIVRIGSVYNLKRIETIFKLYNPNFVYHAAAYKHVPLMEDSPVEAIRTNVVGTYNVASLALKYKITKMILVSTDKAVRPTNVMGATKRFAETIIQYFDSKSNGTSYSAVRFGNVLGSNGSVVPLFTEQIQRGGPVTVTHPKINRFFMTIPEAVSLILQSSLFAKGGEIFILDMGKPMSIVALAEKMIRQAGYTPYKDMKIVFTGLRPGEKLYEEILLDPKTQIKTDNSKIFIEEEKVIFPIEEEMKEISSVFDMESNLDIVEELKKIITTYKDPNEVNKGIE